MIEKHQANEGRVVVVAETARRLGPEATQLLPIDELHDVELEEASADLPVEIGCAEGLDRDERTLPDLQHPALVLDFGLDELDDLIGRDELIDSEVEPVQKSGSPEEWPGLPERGSSSL